MEKNKINELIFIFCLVWLVASCNGASTEPLPSITPEASATPIPPTATSIPPTATATPTEILTPLDPKLLADIEEVIAKQADADSDLIDSIIDRVLENPAAVVSSILPKLGDSNQSEVSLAVYVWILGLTQDPAVIDPLVELAKDTSSILVKRNCIIVLESFGGEQASQGLLSLLEQITDKDLRYEILNILAGMKYEPALPAMGEILEVDPNQEFWKPIFIFGKMGDLAVPYLLTKIDDDDINIRANSISQLGQLLIAPEAAQPLQERYWDEEDPRIRGSILSALEQISPDLKTLQNFAEEVTEKEAEADLVNYAQETLTSLPGMRMQIDSFISEKKISATVFQAEYNALYESYGYGEKTVLASASTLADESQLKKLRERILLRDSDEALYDYFEVNHIIMMNRLAQAIAEQEGKPWEAWPTATPEPTAPPPLGSRNLPKPSQDINGIWFQDIVFSPDGKLIVNNGLDGIEIYDAASFQYLDALEGYSMISDLTFSPNGSQLAFNHVLDGEIWLSIWDLDASEVKFSLSNESEPFSNRFTQYNPDDQILAWGIANKLLLVNPESGDLLENQPDLLDFQAYSAVFSPDGRLLATCCSQSSIVLWDVRQGMVTDKIQVAGPIDMLVITPDGAALLGFESQALKIHKWDLNPLRSNQTPIDLMDINNTFLGDFSFNPDGRFLAVSCSKEELNPRNILVVYDVIQDELLGSIECNLNCSSVAFTPDGKTLAVATPGTLILWDMSLISK